MEVIQGTHRNSALYHAGDGYFFSVILDSGPLIYLRCVEHRKECLAKAVVNFQGYFVTYNCHNHEPDLLRVAISAERRRILNKAADLQRYATISEIFASHMYVFFHIALILFSCFAKVR